MPSLLRSFSFRYMRENMLRSVLTVVGIALGVALFVAVDLVNRSMALSFRSMITDMAGKAVLQVQAKGGGTEAATLGPTVEKVSGVTSVAPVLESMAPLADERGTMVILAGLDPNRETGLRTYSIEQGRWLKEGDEQVVIPAAMAERLNIVPGGEVKLITPAGALNLTLQGVVADEGAALVNSGYVVFMDLKRTQTLLGQSDYVSRFDIAAAQDTDLAKLQSDIETVLPTGIEVTKPTARGSQTESLLKSFKQIMQVGSLIGLFVGMFLVYNTMSINVAHRRQQIGVVRALGLRKRSVLWLIVLESVFLGLFGSVIGAALGLGFGKGMLQLVTQSLASSKSGIGVVAFANNPMTLLIGVIAGLVVSAASAFFPARTASGISPISVIRRDVTVFSWQKTARWMLVLGTLSLLGAIGFYWLQTRTTNTQPTNFSTGALLFGFSMLPPYLIVLASLLLRNPLRKLFGCSGVMAADTMAQNPVRTAIAMAAIIISVGLLMGMSSFVASIQAATENWITQVFSGDLVVMVTEQMAGENLPGMSADLADGLLKADGVQAVYGQRTRYIEHGDQTWALTAMDIAEAKGHLRFNLVQGDQAGVMDEMQKPDTVLVASNLAQRNKIKVGDSLDLETPVGKRSFRVVGTVLDFSADDGAVIIDRAAYQEYWNDSLRNLFNVTVTDRSQADQVAAKIREEFGQKYGVLVYSNEQARTQWTKQVSNFYSSTYALELVALLVSMLGIINTLVVSVLERFREFGILRALGATKRQVLAMVLLEGALISLIGTVVGCLLGYLVFRNMLFLVNQGFGFDLPQAWSWTVMEGTLLVMLLAALGSSYYPARTASNLHIVEVLRYE